MNDPIDPVVVADFARLAELADVAALTPPEHREASLLWRRAADRLDARTVDGDPLAVLVLMARAGHHALLALTGPEAQS